MIKLRYEDFFGSAKAIANLVPMALDNGAEPDDIKQALWGVANLIELGWTDIDESFNREVEERAAARAAEAVAVERAAWERKEPARLTGKTAKGTRT